MPDIPDLQKTVDIPLTLSQLQKLMGLLHPIIKREPAFERAYTAEDMEAMAEINYLFDQGYDVLYHGMQGSLSAKILEDQRHA